MRTGIQGFADDLASPRLTTGVGPGAYDPLIMALRDLRHDATLLAPLARAWADRGFEGVFARPLLLLASWRYLALADPEHPLSHEVLLDAVADDLPARVREALADPALVDVLATRTVVAHDPGRAVAWGLVAGALKLPHRTFAIADVTAGPGLTLGADLTITPFRVGTERIMGLDFPTPGRRLGLDAAPIDITDAAEVRWLRACIWPGQPERLQRLEAALSALRGPWPRNLERPRVETHPLTDPAGTVAHLEALETAPHSARNPDASGEPITAVLALQTILPGALPAADRAAHEAAMNRWLRGDRGRLWLTLEPAPPGPAGSDPMALTVALFREGVIHAVELARTPYHPDGAMLGPGALKRLRGLWAGA